MPFNIGGQFKIGGVTIGANIPFGYRNKKRVTPKSIEEKFAETETRDNSINRMMANVTSSNLFSRPYLYRIILTPPALMWDYAPSAGEMKNILLNCDTISIPGYTLATKPHKIYGVKREYAYEKLFDTISMSFYMSDQMHEHSFFNKWLNLIYIEGRVRYYSEYVSTMTIYQLSRQESGTDEEDLKVMMEVKLIDVYPKTISALPLGHATSGTIQKMTTDIMFRTATYKDYMGKSENEATRGVRSTNSPLNSFKEIGASFSNVLEPLMQPKWSDIIKPQSSSLPAQTIEEFKERNW